MEEQFIRRKASSYDNNGYKIVCGNAYVVYRNEYAGHVFYKIQVTKTDSRDGGNTKVIAYKTIAFRNKEKDCDIPNGTMIVPKKLFEDFYFKDGDKYNAIWTVVILDWDIVKSQNQIVDEAIDNYKKIKDFELSDEDLPF